MPTSSDDDQFTASLRAKLHSSQVDSGRSLSELCQSLGVESVELMRDYFSGKADMPVSLLFRYSRLVGRPIWWFFGEQPATISVEMPWRRSSARCWARRERLGRPARALRSRAQELPERDPWWSISPHTFRAPEPF
jgi:transcriptional regulator with XRE-family HTH domain